MRKFSSALQRCRLDAASCANFSRLCLTIVALSGLTDCASATRSRAWLETAALERARLQIGPRSGDSAHPIPTSVNLSDGINPEEAVAIAMWRSPALQAELTNLDSSLADFDEARRPANPRLSLLAPIDPRQLALLLAWPIEAIWQVPFRTKTANRELERVAELLVQIVLNLERDVRLAYADVRLARARIEVLTKIGTAWREAAEVTESRAHAGDIPLAEAAAVRAEAVLAADSVNRANAEAEMTEARLLALIGAPWPAMPVLAPPVSRKQELPTLELLVSRALRSRPDLRAAELAIHAAAARGRWERSRVFSLVATLDGQAPRGELTPNFSVGAQIELPIFSQNQGGIGRADAAVARAGYLYASARLTVSMEVRVARAGMLRAMSSLAAYESVVTALADAAVSARRSFEDGAESYLVVVDALRRESDARLRRIELEAELARAEAELSRAVGGIQNVEKL